MKLLQNLPALLLTTFLLVGLTACDPRSCDDVICVNQNSYCLNGECVCQNGYEGADCTQLSYQKFIGQYQVNESGCNNGTGRTYFVNIIQGSQVAFIDIVNILDIGLTARAEIYENGNRLYIPNQNLGASSIEGDGYYNANTGRIVINYNYSLNNQFVSCTATFFRQ